MPWSDRGAQVTLLALLVLVAFFVAWELAGLTPSIGAIHTISYLAAHNPILAFLIGVLFVVGGLVGLLWWRRHLRSNIPK